MKKSLKITAVMLCMSVFLSGCGKSWYRQFTRQTVQSKLNTAVVLSDEELYERAKKETSSGHRLDFYSVTTTAETAAENFMKKYPKLEDKIVFHEIDDVQTYDFLSEEIPKDSGTVDMMLTQNGADLNTRLIQKGLAYRYFPEEYLDQIGKDYRLPAAVCLSNTLFIYNNSQGKIDINNIWQFTEDEWKGKIYFKNPLDETENINFLVMLTSPEWTERISEAYKNYYGNEWDNSNSYQSASYEWIDRFLKNCDFSHGSNSQICADIADADSTVMGLFVFNKTRKLEEDQKKHLNVLAYEAETDCFTGYMYAIYATVAKNTDCPYTCALFINYLLSAEGFSGEGSWNQHPGYYSANTAVHKTEEIDDRDFGFWERNLVVEDSDYIQDNLEEGRGFIESCLNTIKYNNIGG